MSFYLPCDKLKTTTTGFDQALETGQLFTALNSVTHKLSETQLVYMQKVFKVLGQLAESSKLHVGLP